MKKINTDIAYDYIRRRIISGEYAPGQSLVAEMLSVETGVSRTPVRDALRKLEADGLVSIRARQGASVKSMDVNEFREMSELRMALETHAAGLAAMNRTESELREIHFALEEMGRLTQTINASPVTSEPGFLEELKREDVRFHLAIMVAAKNELMKREILRLHLINRIVAGPNIVRQWAEEKSEWDARRLIVQASHNDIYLALAKGDVAAARQAMADHIQDLITTNLKRMEKSTSRVAERELTDEEMAYGF